LSILKKTVSFISLLFLLIFIVAFATSCATVKAPAVQTSKAPPVNKVYSGAGKSTSLIEAINRAKMDAVKKAVIDTIGVANEQANSEILNEVLYNTKNTNAFILTDTYKTVRKDKIGNNYIIECEVAVNSEAVKNTLRANGLLGGETVTKAKKTEGAAAVSNAQTKKPAAAVAEPMKEAALTPEEQQVIRKYVQNMTYMVYFSESSKEDPFYMKSAVGIADEYLASHSMEAVDLSQIEKLKKDQQKVYEEETGESISIIQWIAQKLNADIYIEIDGITNGERSGKNFYGQASITLKVFEASTGRLLGSVPWNSPKTFSTASERTARINAIQTSVYKAMPIAIQQSQAYMYKALRNGIRYELIVQNTSDPKLMSQFRRKLKRKVKSIKTVSQTAQETKYQVYYIGSLEDLVDIIYDVAEAIPGLENMEQVLLRGKSVTFDTGL